MFERTLLIASASVPFLASTFVDASSQRSEWSCDMRPRKLYDPTYQEDAALPRKWRMGISIESNNKIAVVSDEIAPTRLKSVIHWGNPQRSNFWTVANWSNANDEYDNWQATYSSDDFLGSETNVSVQYFRTEKVRGRVHTVEIWAKGVCQNSIVTP